MNNLSQNIEPFSKEDRHKLLNGLATEFRRLQDLQGASRLWSQLAEQEPNDLELRLNLLELAFQTANSDEIDKNIKQIEQIEGNDGLLGRYCQVRYLIWQAERAMVKEPQEALRLRTKARVLLKSWRRAVRTGRSFPWLWPNWNSRNYAKAICRPRKSRQRKRVSSANTAALSNLVSAIRPSCAKR